ncbi:Glutathione-dependent formaldehyde-activating enzyme [Sulfitobacter sp. THAF37]|uniref:GFA family protein n=1 Tax=Sulfitobacter sp. THAF37 TaxID=2587855 RepID=UPI0012681C00|nr:GFA family protein [Sulfitobacter sp. THAF37]QFT58082.1 Glutathione-dependent formaldehyde-activating enzyme [Sulfitobacter sp. THAF37]
MPTAEAIGKCLCGAVRITVTDPVGWVGVCHCAMCRRWSGSVFACFPAAPETVAISGPVKIHASSSLAERAFCGDCGSHLWMRDRDDTADFDLMPGLFDATKDWPLRSEIYCDEAPVAFALAGDHPKATADQYRKKYPRAQEVIDDV